MNKDFLSKLAEWVTIGLIIGGFLIAEDRRITAMEVNLQQEMKGYLTAFAEFTKKIERLDDKVDRLLEENRRR